MTTTSATINALTFIFAVAIALPIFISLIALSGTGYIAFIRNRLAGLFKRLPERKMTWGTVYDSETKRPIPYAKVELLDEGNRLLEMRVTGRDGRFGFLAMQSSIYGAKVRVHITPIAQGYKFPAEAKPTVDDFLYGHLYYGGVIEVGEELVNVDIPMDPLSKSSGPLILRAPSILLRSTVAALADIGLWIGALAIPLNVILAPNPFTFGTLFLYLGALSLRLSGIRQEPFGLVLDKDTRKPMSFALLMLLDEKGQRAAFAVSDEKGRYFMAARNGPYELRAHTSAQTLPARTISERVRISRGWLTREIIL